MANVVRVYCRSWEQFSVELRSLLFAGGPFAKGEYLFRGQRDPDWTLTSSFDRWFDQGHYEEATRVSIAQDLVRRFKRELEALDIQREIREEPKMVVALGQQYGLPTRLLDWSESPYIAAFFAFSDALFFHQQKSHVAVWALQASSYVWSPDRGAQILTIPPVGNVRLRNQEGKFTLLNTPHNCLEDYVNASDAVTPPPLTQFLLPSPVSRIALADLDAMGINPSRIFPDPQGCALSAELQLRLAE